MADSLVRGMATVVTNKYAIRCFYVVEQVINFVLHGGKRCCRCQIKKGRKKYRRQRAEKGFYYSIHYCPLEMPSVKGSLNNNFAF